MNSQLSAGFFVSGGGMTVTDLIQKLQAMQAVRGNFEVFIEAKEYFFRIKNLELKHTNGNGGRVVIIPENQLRKIVADNPDECEGD